MAMSALLPATALHISVSPKTLIKSTSTLLRFFIPVCINGLSSCAATACFGDDQTEFPSSNLFAAAGDGIWDNGASCGRQYLVRCISASQPGTCVPDQTIQVKIVDYAPTALSPSSAESTTIVLSETAFGGITNTAADSINIEFQQ
ncbi:hypothetical protein V6N13_000353 [Hibiscus sabdariffa]|uniref:Expansin-like EG45 domain-containing protein n=1 Tax=Hibiscus sabdariffa TaxID=183260 RepID=A0ABR2G5I4_9ROSI